MEKSVYARIINDCLKVAKGEALLRISEEKYLLYWEVTAVIMRSLTWSRFLHSVEYLHDNFKGCKYLGGFYEHDMASALWELTGEDKLLEAYKEELILHGKSVDEMKPMVRITTSDTGAGGANIFPMIVSGKRIPPSIWESRCVLDTGTVQSFQSLMTS